MTRQEITEHAANVRDNNDSRSMQALMDQFGPMMNELATRYDRGHHEDAMQDACIGLMMAARRFNPEKGFTFSTIACAYMSGYILRGISTRRPVHDSPNREIDELLADPDFVALNRPMSLTALAGEDGWDLTHYTENGFETVDNRDEAESIRRVLSEEIDAMKHRHHPSDTRSEKERASLTRRAARLWAGLETGSHMSAAKVAEILNCGSSEARQMIRKTIRHLKTRPRVVALKAS